MKGKRGDALRRTAQALEWDAPKLEEPFVDPAMGDGLNALFSTSVVGVVLE